MKKTLLLLLTLCLAGNIMAASQNKTDKQGRKQGAWVKTYKNGKTQYEGQFKDDKPVGTFKRYYEDGKLQSVQVYDASGTSDITFYDTDGKTLASEGHFDGKLKVGEWKYYADGKVVLSEVYLNGQRHGVSKTYNKGSLMEETPYVNGLIEGVRKAYLENGKLYSTTTYKAGKMNGAYRLYEGNDKPVEEGQFENDRKTGEWVMYDEKGNKIDGTSYAGGRAVNEKEIKKQNSAQFDENQKAIDSKKYVEPTEMFGGTVITK